MACSKSNRRQFIKGAVGGALTAALAAQERVARGEDSLTRVDALPTGVVRTWIGPWYWANRLQDWQLNTGRIESRGDLRCRTVSVLTREIVAGTAACTLRVRMGTLALAPGFSGFLIGVGAGELDYRAAALAYSASGTGGGLLCVYDTDGRVRFRDHTSESSQFAYTALGTPGTAGPARSTLEDVTLTLEIIPATGAFDLLLTARATSTGAILSRAALLAVPEWRIVGGFALASSRGRHWFRDLMTGGAKIAEHPERRFGPILGTMFSVADDVMRLNAVVAPVGRADPQMVQLQYRLPGGWWYTAPALPLGSGYNAVFSVYGWDSSQQWEYRVLYGYGTPQQDVYTGTIPADPAPSGRATVGLLSCMGATARPTDRASSGLPRLPGERFLGLYSPENLYFPHAALARNLASHRPDILFFVGDQIYESVPTNKDTALAPTLDFLYRWYLWIWSFRELTRSVPTICLVDDHDVYQGNIWGHSGAPAPSRDFARGGYANAAAWVNMVQSLQCGHNPSPYDPTPVLQNIGVYYCAFQWAGVSFAVVEGRKFKTGDQDGLNSSGAPYPPESLELLGPRQEQFLQDWARWPVGMPRICATQTAFCCLQTGENGVPMIDYDTNAYPTHKRDLALSLLKEAGALILSGDQHRGSLVRHGISGFTDGPVEFTGPAAAAKWQRWFEPAVPLSDPAGTPNTGRYTDAFGNRMRVLAVANPRISQAQFRAAYPTGPTEVGDRVLKREGYGIVRVDGARREFIIECWPLGCRSGGGRRGAVRRLAVLAGV